MQGNRFADYEDEGYANKKGVQNQGRFWIFAGIIPSPRERKEHDKATQVQEESEDCPGFAVNMP
jgi:hypothetical protein